MNTGSKRYDPDLQMFVVDHSREPDLGHLRFLRWLNEQGRLEHRMSWSMAGVSTEETPEPPPAA
jgi:hypothetical protein